MRALGVNNIKKTILIVLFFFFLLWPIKIICSDVPDFIVFEVWIEADPLIPSEIYTPLSVDDINRLLLEEARWTAGGMIYGFKVHYIIGDRSRNLQEKFVMDPIGTIHFGDPHFYVLDTRLEKTKAIARVRYNLQDHQIRWLRRFTSVGARHIQGTGESPLYLGSLGRISSYEEAVKAGIRSMLQHTERNRPREVFCTVVLEKPPRTVVDAGSYRSTVRMKVVIDELIPHVVY